MKIEIESTAELVDLCVNGRIVSRVWRGKTAEGRDVLLFVTAVAVPSDGPYTDFERELLESTFVATPQQEAWMQAILKGN